MLKKYRFRANGEGAAVSTTDPITGEVRVAEFKNGVFETADPGWVNELSWLASIPGHPISEDKATKGR